MIRGLTLEGVLVARGAQLTETATNARAVRVIIHKGIVLAIIIRSDFREQGIHFFTPNDFSQQVAYMHYFPGKIIDPHIHNHIVRKVHYTQEVLVLRRGKLRVDFYDDVNQYLESTILVEGDVILLASGGHGFEVLEELEMIEVKQGPFAGSADKTRFPAITSEFLKIKG
jgi:mannose-6-phosphate isomerase-like protein (cupin superfamily)